jgi:hypothetical protein
MPKWKGLGDYSRVADHSSTIDESENRILRRIKKSPILIAICAYFVVPNCPCARRIKGFGLAQ